MVLGYPLSYDNVFFVSFFVRNVKDFWFEQGGAICHGVVRR